MGSIYGLLGQKLGHSHSIPIHAGLGRPDYRLIELQPEELKGFLRREDIGGLNVTIPYKRAVMPYCDWISEDAQSIGSVNTIVRREGRLLGYNTDAYGFAYMAKLAGISFAGKKVAVLGSGGASLTAQSVARAEGAEEVAVISRGGGSGYGNLELYRDARILVNATPVGMFPDTGGSPVTLDVFPRCEGVLDLIYNPLRTRLITGAERRGIPCSGGLPMLVAQAKMAEELFFGKHIPDGELRRILGLVRASVENIVLIGMPGSGKSTLGNILARLSGRELVDIDAETARAAGASIEHIFAARGEAGFRKLEREATAEAGRRCGCIIVTGGGVVKDGENYFPLHCNGRIYHIMRDTGRLAREGRPLSLKGDLQLMYRERLPMYEAFRDAAVSNDGRPEDAAEMIWRDFCENTCAERP